MTDLQRPSTAVSGPVQLRLPPEPHMARVLRLAASGLASLAGFSVDEIENLKLAVSEILIVLIEHGVGAPIDVNIDVDPLGFRIHARTAMDRLTADDPDLDLCRIVLDSVCEFHEVGVQGDQIHVHAVLLRGD